MAEKAGTGGLKEFHYPKGYTPPKDEELEVAVEEGYAQYHERKKRQKRNRIALGIILTLVLLIIIFGFVLL